MYNSHATRAHSHTHTHVHTRKRYTQRVETFSCKIYRHRCMCCMNILMLLNSNQIRNIFTSGVFAETRKIMTKQKKTHHDLFIRIRQKMFQIWNGPMQWLDKRSKSIISVTKKKNSSSNVDRQGMEKKNVFFNDTQAHTPNQKCIIFLYHTAKNEHSGFLPNNER